MGREPSVWPRSDLQTHSRSNRDQRRSRACSHDRRRSAQSPLPDHQSRLRQQRQPLGSNLRQWRYSAQLSRTGDFSRRSFPRTRRGCFREPGLGTARVFISPSGPGTPDQYALTSATKAAQIALASLVRQRGRWTRHQLREERLSLTPLPRGLVSARYPTMRFPLDPNVHFLFSLQRMRGISGRGSTFLLQKSAARRGSNHNFDNQEPLTARGKTESPAAQPKARQNCA